MLIIQTLLQCTHAGHARRTYGTSSAYIKLFRKRLIPSFETFKDTYTVLQSSYKHESFDTYLRYKVYTLSYI